MDKELCPICGEGHVTGHVDQVEREYKGQKAMVPLHYQVCDTCTSESAGAAESRLNKRAVLAFRKSVDGLLTGVEIVALRKQYRLTQDQAAKLFGGGPVAFSKYENDDVAHSEAMDKLLRLVLKSETAFWALVDQEGMTMALAPKRMQTKPRVYRTQSTNVIQVSFRNNDFMPSRIAASRRYEPVEPTGGPQRWKR